MSVNIIKIEPRILKTALVLIAVLSIGAAWFFARWSFANAVASRIDTKLPESKLVIDSLVGMGPSDPLTHHAAAAIYERTFDPSDLERSLKEYEMATALSPNSYQAWVNLGRARDVSGDIDGADAALRRAMELAPNYSSVQWAYGNFLIRQGRREEGFRLAATAANANPELARNAVSLALQIFEGGVNSVIAVLGEAEATGAALAATLGAQERHEDAVSAWSRLSAQSKVGANRKLGEDLVAKLSAAKKFRLAAQVLSDLQSPEAQRAETGKVTNGGFELPIKLRGAPLFDWQIGEGTEPQVGLSDSQKRSGGYGLLLIFNSFEAANIRTLSQTVAVEPGARYQFQAFYRSDLKTTASLKLEVADAATGITLAASPPLALAGDWATIRFDLQVPASSDGIIIRLGREGCTGPACRIAGRLSFDDVSLNRL